jgi:hypothetical protein
MPTDDSLALLVVPPQLEGEEEGDPVIYKIPLSVYTNPDFRMPPEEGGIVREMVKYGAAFGYLPNINVGVGVQCYLVNLRSLKT